MKRYLMILSAFAAFAGFCRGDDEETKETLSLTFGVYQSDKATTMYRMFVPIIEAIQERVEAEMDKSVDIHLKIFKTYDEGIDALVAGEVDFVRFGPASYMLSKNRNPEIRLLAMELNDGQKRFNGMIIVQADSPYQSLQDLRGRSFAFGDKNSTIGRYLAQAEFVRAGIYVEDLGKYEYLGRHDKVATAVRLGDFDAGCLKESTYKKYNKDGKLRVLKKFDNVTKPWAARKGLDPVVYGALQKSLVELKNPEVLKELKVSGFCKAEDEDYQFVKSGMKAAEYFFPKTDVAQNK